MEMNLPMWQDMPFLWAVAGVVFLGMLGYTFNVWRRQRQVQEDLERLERTLQELSRK
jgi:uncharacterized oligopeptide transporter (OPT) family protein